MEKPATKLICDCIAYYLLLCEAKGDSPDTIVNKVAGLDKFQCRRADVAISGKPERLYGLPVHS